MRTRSRHMAYTALFYATAFLCALPAAPASAQQKGPAGISASAEDSARAAHLLSRATFGARAGDLGAVLRDGPDAWVARQLEPGRIRDTAAAAIAARYPVLDKPPVELVRTFDPRQGGRPPQQLLSTMAIAKVMRSAQTERQLEEVMTDFWFNHFNVFFQKGTDKFFVADYERTAIRPFVFGRFEDMLRATARHPAMLFYLDNWQSVSPPPVVQRAPAGNAQPNRRERGINENYARELLELHTLGVEGGYTQADIGEVARAFTGWTFNPLRQGDPGMQGAFVFRPLLHDRGGKVVLGQSLAGGRGIEDGDDVLHLLATHPSTAKFIAHKLVLYFVSDSGSPLLEARLADVFLESGGDLRLVTRTLFTDSLFYATAVRRSKVKTPFQLVVSALRATDAEITGERGVLQVLRTMGQLPYMASPPTGYPHASEDWVNSAAMLARMNFGIDLATGRIAGVAPRSRALPFAPSPSLEQAIAADIAMQTDLPPRARAARELGLLLGSPEFQRR